MQILLTATLGILSVLPKSPVLARQPANAEPWLAAECWFRLQPTSTSRVTPRYQRRKTWDEFLLRRLNPGNTDYGAWIEQRRLVFIESATNPYFAYSAAVTAVLLVLTMIYAKQRIDHRRSMWITAEMMTDLYNHDFYSRQIARDAIHKYNDHVERCNQAGGGRADGTSLNGAESDTDRLRSELLAVTGERDTCRRERDTAKQDLAEKERVLADMSLRLEALSRKIANRGMPSAVDVQSADQRLVQHINSLQEQLYVQRQGNKRIKGR